MVKICKKCMFDPNKPIGTALEGGSVRLNSNGILYLTSHKAHCTKEEREKEVQKVKKMCRYKK